MPSLKDRIKKIFGYKKPAPITLDRPQNKITPAGHWKTKDGTVLKISEMETTHIENCINLIEKKAERALDKCELNFLVYDDERDPFFDDYGWDAAVIEYCKKYREYHDLWRELDKRDIDKYKKKKI